MTPTEYRKKLENQLITEFRDKFFEKLGYYPTVLTNKRSKNEDTIVLSLEELEKYFDPYLPKRYGKILPLGHKERCRDLVELRSIFFFLARTMNYGLKVMGNYLNGRDHTTVIHNITTFRNLYDTDAKFKEKYFTILNRIKQDHEPSTMEHTDKVGFES